MDDQKRRPGAHPGQRPSERAVASAIYALAGRDRDAPHRSTSTTAPPPPPIALPWPDSVDQPVRAGPGEASVPPADLGRLRTRGRHEAMPCFGLDHRTADSVGPLTPSLTSISDPLAKTIGPAARTPVITGCRSAVGTADGRFNTTAHAVTRTQAGTVPGRDL